MAARLVALPATDGELEQTLRRLEEVLRHLQPCDEDADRVPAGLGPDGIDAIRRVLDVVEPALGGPAAALVAADGRTRLAPLRFVTVDDQDLATLGLGVAALGRSRLPGGDERARAVLREACYEHGERSALLVERLARAHGVLDLTPNHDTRLLAGLLDRRTGPIRLTAVEERAYRRLMERVLTMFQPVGAPPRGRRRGPGRG